MINSVKLDPILKQLQQTFMKRAESKDDETTTAIANLSDIVKYGLQSVNLPVAYGGEGYGLLDTCSILIELAQGCPSTALAMAMHYYSIGALRELLTKEQKDSIFNDVYANGALVGSINDPNIMLVQSEEDLRRVTTVRTEKTENGYLVSGMRKYVTWAPLIKYLPLFAYEESGQGLYKTTALIMEMSYDGVIVKPTWNSIAMRGSMTHQVEMQDVFIAESNRIGEEGRGIEQTQQLVYWFRICTSAVYYGIAKCAFDYILNYVKYHRESASGSLLAKLPGVQYRLADMYTQLEASYSQLVLTAQMYDHNKKNTRALEEVYNKTLSTKQYVTRAANDVVWHSIQIQGTTSLNKGSLLERLNRDVRVGLFHPPQEDFLKEILAKRKLGFIRTKSRWT